MNEKKFNGPLCLIIMDGIADNPNEKANAVIAANTPTLDKLRTSVPMTHLTTFGKAVGLPEGQMGNSEVGHLNIGAGRIVKQELTIINETVRDSKLKDIAEFRDICSSISGEQALHLVGLVSTGGVHSSLEHLKGIISEAVESGVKKVYLHCITDGRDRPTKAAEEEVLKLDTWLKELSSKTASDLRIVDIIGRYFAMDRDTRWERTSKAYDLFTKAKGEEVTSASEALKTSYERGTTDEFIEPFSIQTPDGKRSAVISDNDSLLFFNFRADRMRQIAKAFFSNDNEFNDFKRAAVPNLSYIASLTEYEDDFPLQIVFKPKEIKNHLGEYVSTLGLSQLRIAETEKYPHVTYFFNGGNEEPYAKEERFMAPSPRDVPTYDLKPEMNAAGVTEKLLERLQSSEPLDLIVVNFANGDMVGHTGDFEATKRAVETVDHSVKQIIEQLASVDGLALITADHGNADQLIDYLTGEPHTFHTTHPVPFFLVGNSMLNVKLRSGALCDIAPTICELLGLEKPVEMTGESLISSE